MSKRAVIFSLILLFGFAVAPVDAQMGLYRQTQPIKSRFMLGGDLVFGSLGLDGHVRFGISEYMDLGIKLGFIRESDETILDLGFDGKYMVMSVENYSNPVDMSVVGFLNFQHWGSSDMGFDVSASLLFAGAGVQFGRSFPTGSSNLVISPYTGLLLGVFHSDIDVETNNNPLSGSSEGDTEFGGLIPIGCEILLTSNFSVLFEMGIAFADDSDIYGAVGCNFFF